MRAVGIHDPQGVVGRVRVVNPSRGAIEQDVASVGRYSAPPAVEVRVVGGPRQQTPAGAHQANIVVPADVGIYDEIAGRHDPARRREDRVGRRPVRKGVQGIIDHPVGQCQEGQERHDRSRQHAGDDDGEHPSSPVVAPEAPPVVAPEAPPAVRVGPGEPGASASIGVGVAWTLRAAMSPAAPTCHDGIRPSARNGTKPAATSVRLAMSRDGPDRADGG